MIESPIALPTPSNPMMFSTAPSSVLLCDNEIASGEPINRTLKQMRMGVEYISKGVSLETRRLTGDATHRAV
jgi:hypothetical protein